MKKIIIFTFCFYTLLSNAQTPDDALRTAFYTQNGTARLLGIGGTMGSLGGDISTAHINPAGLGFYKSNELILSPGLLTNNNKFNYRGTDSTSSKNSTMYGTSGLVLASNSGGRSNWTSSAFSFSINQLANYNNLVQFRGYNNQSSYTEKYLEELTRDKADTNAALSNYIFGSSLAFRTFLIDTLNGTNGSLIGYQSLVPYSSGINQTYISQTSGGYNELAIGFAGNQFDKLYLGGSLTIPIIKYTRSLYYSEKDATANTNNSFNNFEYQETYSSNGSGIGLKLGVIFKPQKSIRIGFAFHTPQYILLTDKIRSSLKANTESYAGVRSENSDNLNSGNAGSTKYHVTTPYRLIASASFIFNETKDIRRQRGFISADVEYVNYRGTRYSSANENSFDASLNNYYKLLNEIIKETYMGNINAKIGGELKFNTIMIRLGGAYYGSPYADKNLQVNRVIGSGGLGYRNKGMFIDFSYSHIMNKDVQFPYLLNDKPNTYATQTGNRGSLMFTIGFKI